MYIYQLPYTPRKNLVDALNLGDSWRDLGGKFLGYSPIELESFARSCYLPGHSPADAMLTHWGQKNYSVVELFKYLYKMEHYHAMEALREVVPKKYHAAIKAPVPSGYTATFGAAANAPPLPSSSRAPPPPQPLQANYKQAPTHLRVNLNAEANKETSLKKCYNAQKIAPAATQHSPSSSSSK